MNRRLGGDSSLNAPLSRDTDGGGEWQDWLVDDEDTPDVAYEQSEEQEMRSKLLHQAMNGLNERERRIFEARRMSEDPMTLEDLSQEFNVSRERIRQIEVKAYEKVEKAVRKASAELLG